MDISALLAFVDREKNTTKTALKSFIDYTVDTRFDRVKGAIVRFVQSGQVEQPPRRGGGGYDILRQRRSDSQHHHDGFGQLNPSSLFDIEPPPSMPRTDGLLIFAPDVWAQPPPPPPPEVPLNANINEENPQDDNHDYYNQQQNDLQNEVPQNEARQNEAPQNADASQNDAFQNADQPDNLLTDQQQQPQQPPEVYSDDQDYCEGCINGTCPDWKTKQTSDTQSVADGAFDGGDRDLTLAQTSEAQPINLTTNHQGIESSTETNQVVDSSNAANDADDEEETPNEGIMKKYSKVFESKLDTKKNLSQLFIDTLLHSNDGESESNVVKEGEEEQSSVNPENASASDSAQRRSPNVRKRIPKKIFTPTVCMVVSSDDDDGGDAGKKAHKKSGTKRKSYQSYGEPVKRELANLSVKKEEFDDGYGDGDPQFHCTAEGCGRHFYTQSYLMQHVDMAHRVEKPYRCTFESCGQLFAHRGTAVRHVTSVHFKLPRTKKEQREMNIVGERDPHLFVLKEQ